jgi:hypothetical protein
MNKYEFLEQIGEGAYGTVSKAREKVKSENLITHVAPPPIVRDKGPEKGQKPQTK